MAFIWSKDLETGNTMIDGQHKQLVQAVNNLLTACANGEGRAEISKTMQFLSDYTEKHFSDEEKLQQQYSYPDYPNHKRYHEEFKKTVRAMAGQLKAEGPTITLVGKVNANIGGWLVNHIKRQDTLIAAHIRALSK